MKNTKTRILFGINQLNIGGAERQLFELATNLKELNYSPQVFSLSNGGEYADLLRLKDIPVIIAKRRIRSDLQPIRQISGLLREQQFDIIHLFGFYAGFYGRIAAISGSNSIIIYSIRSTRIESLRSRSNPIYFFVDRILSAKTDAITANAKSVKEYAVEHMKLPETKIHVIYNGIGDEWFNKLNSSKDTQKFIRSKYKLPENCLLVGNVARLDPEKDHLTFINAAKIVSQFMPNVYFLIIGDGPLYNDLQNYTRIMKLQKRVIFSGTILGHELKEYYDSLDIFVSSSRSEGLSNSILEAMARGKPIVATRVSGTPELIENGINGLLVKIGDEKNLATSITRLLTDCDYAKMLGNEGMKIAKSRFSVVKMVNQYDILYKDLIRNHK